ncbi:MAG: hypothetical protein MK103_08675, partial [Planctomycetes bacterium]|nr:hypothetical protein [Planctomycetota bacterium]
MRSCVWIMAVGLLLPAAIQSETQCRAQGTVPREEATPALKPHESVKRFKIPEDLDIRVRGGWVKGLNRLYFLYEAHDDYWNMYYSRGDIFEIAVDADR